jgi:short chain dehydrogenase
MKQVIVITGASSGFGRLTANALAKAGHTVYASMRETTGRNAAVVADVEKFARDNKVDLRALELDVDSQDSADVAIAKIVAEQGHLDVVMHNAGHMVFGPADVHARTTGRTLRHQCAEHPACQSCGVAATAQAGQRIAGLGVEQQLGRRHAALSRALFCRQGRHGCACRARELSRWGIETSIIVPGAFTGGTNHFAHSGSPADRARAAKYEAGPYAGFGEQIMKAFSAIVPPEADAGSVADAIVKIVDMPFGQRPFRVHIDPTQDGAEVAFAVIDRVRNEMLHRVGFSDLLHPKANG